MWAADARSAELTRFLIGHKADVNARALANDWPSQMTGEPRNQYRPTGGMTPLLYAARSGCTDCVAALLDAGADPNRPNPDGVTPLIVAIDNFAFDTAKLLFERGANPHVWDWWGRTRAVHGDRHEYLQSGCLRRTHRAAHRDGRRPPRSSSHDCFWMPASTPIPQLNMHRPGRGGNSGRFADEIMTTGATPHVARRRVTRQRGRAAVAGSRRACRRAQRDGRDAADGRRGARHGTQPALQSRRQGCAGSVDRDARNADGDGRRRECADHRRQEQDRALGAWQHAARSGAGRARCSARCNGPGPAWSSI